MSDYLDEVALEEFAARNAVGARLAGVLATPRARSPRALAILLPGFGRTARQLAGLSTLLNRQGYASLRTDFSNHVGRSDGEIRNATLSRARLDVDAVLAARPLADLPAVVVGASVAARAVVQSLAAGSHASGLVLLLPVVDLRRTLARTLGRDVVGDWLAGEALPETIEINGFAVDAAFVPDVVEHGFVHSARDDVAALGMPVAAVCASRDEWVEVGEVEHALGPLRQGWRELLVLEGGTHDIAHSPPLQRLLYDCVVRAVAAAAGDELEHVEEVSFSDYVRAMQAERRWLAECEREPA